MKRAVFSPHRKKIVYPHKAQRRRHAGFSIRYKKQTPELDDLFERLYEDNVSGKISDERFATMSARYEAEQSKLKADAAKLSETISRKEQKKMM